MPHQVHETGVRKAARGAVQVLMELGLSRPEAQSRVDAALERLGEEAAVEQLVREAFHRGTTAAEG